MKNYDGTSSHTLKSQFDTFTYDGVFNMTGLTTSNNAVSSFNGTNTWTYDSKDRLTGDALTGGAAYSLTNAYDTAGNPTTYRNVASQTFNADNQKTASGTFVYDGNGNPTTYAGGTLTFDPMDKMVSITSSGTGSYRYRADGLRAWKGWNVTIPTVSGIPVSGATYFLYDGGNPVVEMDSNGSVTAVNVFAHDGLVARVEGSTAKYYQFDAQGSVAHRTNTSGAVTSSSKYEAYGKHVNIPGSTVDVYGWNARWGYYYDSETGLYLCQQRYYDSNQGRWLNRDPIGYRGGINVYGYCGGSPLGWVDSIGLTRVTAYYYLAGSGLGMDGYHMGIEVMDGKGRRWYYAGGPENYGMFLPGSGAWGNLVDKQGRSGDGGQEDTHPRSGGVVLVDDCSSAKEWLGKFGQSSADLDGREIYDFPGPNSNSWTMKLLADAGLMDEYMHATTDKVWGDPWLPGFNWIPWGGGTFGDWR